MRCSSDLGLPLELYLSGAIVYKRSESVTIYVVIRSYYMVRNKSFG